MHALHAARLVEWRRDGQRIVYRVADLSVEALLRALKGTAAIDRGELIARTKNGTVALIDVRPRDELEQAHLPGALSVPLDEVKAWAKTAQEPSSALALDVRELSSTLDWSARTNSAVVRTGLGLDRDYQAEISRTRGEKRKPRKPIGFRGFVVRDPSGN